MKRISLIFGLIILTSFATYSQVIDVVTELNSPWGLVINNDKLYISESGSNKVLEFDMTSENTIDFVTSVERPFGLLQRNNDLLIAEHEGFKISTKDLTLSPSTASDFIIFQMSSFDELWGMELSQDQNTLFISETGGRVYKADLTQTNPVPELFWENIDGTTIDLALNGDDLYISESESENGLGRILKIDVSEVNPTATEVVTDLFFPIGLEIVGTNLFFTNYNEQGNGTDTLNSINLSQANPEVITILNNLDTPRYITYADGELYISQNNKVSKIPLGQLGIDDLNASLDFKIYPNPTKDIINLSNMGFNTNFEIYDVLGNRISSGSLTRNIDVSSFSSGIYFLKIQETVNQFIKI